MSFSVRAMSWSSAAILEANLSFMRQLSAAMTRPYNEKACIAAGFAVLPER
jgi:hypothetical protein